MLLPVHFETIASPAYFFRRCCVRRPFYDEGGVADPTFPFNCCQGNRETYEQEEQMLEDISGSCPSTPKRKETRNFEECPASDEENLVTHQKLSLGDALVHTEALLNYLEQEDESTPAEQMILRNVRSIIPRRINEKQKQTSIISFFTKQLLEVEFFGERVVKYVLSGCPPLDLEVRTNVLTSQHIQRIKNSREIGGLLNFDFEMARKPWEPRRWSQLVGHYLMRAKH
ncbi:hypothetical protein AVEN_265026-1 [Araneus ventricosus]|uniref:Uncharacterized protein n=1 Tax=Araneus ventricosus TaxID=182803 RepID=A0A4Y2EIG8_ARAVE|nr:hypothetical protein AVEN_265026-1 [Araneus ventricosus]